MSSAPRRPVVHRRGHGQAAPARPGIASARGDGRVHAHSALWERPGPAGHAPRLRARLQPDPRGGSPHPRRRARRPRHAPRNPAERATPTCRDVGVRARRAGVTPGRGRKAQGRRRGRRRRRGGSARARRARGTRGGLAQARRPFRISDLLEADGVAADSGSDPGAAALAQESAAAAALAESLARVHAPILATSAEVRRACGAKAPRCFQLTGLASC